MLKVELIEQAKRLAISAHEGQLYGDKPYMYHVNQVVELCQPFGEEAMVIAFLHDVVEDTVVSLAQIRQTFGERIALCVEALTDPDVDSRKIRKTVSHQKLAAINHHGPYRLALIVKAADRLANTQTSSSNGRIDKLTMYRKEYPAFRQAAYRQGLCDDIWQRLDNLNL